MCFICFHQVQNGISFIFYFLIRRILLFNFGQNRFQNRSSLIYLLQCMLVPISSLCYFWKHKEIFLYEYSLKETINNKNCNVQATEFVEELVHSIILFWIRSLIKVKKNIELGDQMKPCHSKRCWFSNKVIVLRNCLFWHKFSYSCFFPPVHVISVKKVDCFVPPCWVNSITSSHFCLLNNKSLWSHYNLKWIIVLQTNLILVTPK